ncbi:MAG: PAS domain S-box protein, partial [Thermoplasmata archaeon]|nr:PAS domain S-box protein [Thermoplasmata archaeon]
MAGKGKSSGKTGKKKNITSSDERYKILFESSSDAIMLLDSNRFFDCNKATLEMFGQTREEFIKLHPSEISPPTQPNGKDSRTEADEKIAVAFKKGTNKFEWMHMRKNGVVFPAHVWLTAFPLKGKKVLQATVRDITELKEAQSELESHRLSLVTLIGERTDNFMKEMADRKKAEIEVRRLIKAVETSFNAIALFDMDMNITYVNNSFCKLSGASMSQLVTMNAADFIPEESLIPLSDAVIRAIDGEEINQIDVKVKNAQGEEFWVAIAGSVLFAENGEPNGMLAIINDITERKNILEALQESEDKYRTLVEKSNDGILIIQDEKTVYMNPALARLSGYTLEEQIGRPFIDNVAPESRKKVMKFYNARMKGQNIGTIYEMLMLSKEGFKIPVEINAVLIEYNDKPADFVFIRDLTERRRAEKELNALTQLQKALLSAVPDIIMQVNVDKVYTWANKPGIEFFGDDVVGKEASDFFVGEQNTYDLVSPIFNGQEEQFYVESWQRRRDGEVRLLAWWCRVLKDEEDNVIGALSTARDITEKNRAEENLRENEEKYRKLMESANDAIFLADAKTGLLIDVNQKATKLIGRTKDELIGMHQAELHPKGMAKKYQEIIKMHIKEGSAIEEDIYALHKDGRKIPITISASTFELDGVPLIQGIFHDLTARVEAEKEVLRLKELSESTINNSPIGIVTTDLGGNILSANPALINMLGSPNEEKTKEFNVLTLEPMVKQGLSKLFAECLKKGKKIKIESMAYISLLGKSSTVSINIVPLKDVDGKQIGMVALIEDITERSHARDALFASEKIYRGLYESTIALADSTDLGEVIAIIAEQAKNMLDGIYSTIYLWDENNHELVPFYTNARKDRDKFMKHRLKLGEGLTGRVAQEKKGRYVNYDSDTENIRKNIPGTRKDRNHILSIIAEPMLKEKHLLGVINVVAEERIFNDGDLSKIEIVAHQATIAYMRSQNVDALTQSEGRFRKMAENIHDGLTIIEEGQVTYVNDR